MGGRENSRNPDRLINFGKQIRFTELKNELNFVNPRLRGFEYKFRFPENIERPKGEAQIIYTTLKYYGEIGANKLFDTLTARGIKPVDIIACINEFFPNGRGTDKEIVKYVEQGFGAEILEFITEESKMEGAKVLYVQTREEKMRDFIMKRGFERVDEKNEQKGKFFKILDQKN